MRIILALIASAGLVSCVGDVSPIIDDGSGTPEEDNPAQNDLTPAKEIYDRDVFPIMTGKCSGGTCHSEAGAGGSITRFVAADRANGWKIATNYTALVGGYTNAAPILTKIEPGNHQGAVYTTDEKDKIVAWLAKELELRQNVPPPTPGGESLNAAADRVMGEFAGCMTLANFTASNMAQAWGQQVQSQEGPCRQCHNNAGWGFIANENANLMFPVVSTKKMYWLQYFTVDLSGGAAAAKVLVNKVSFAGVYNNQAPHAAHPRFNYPNNNGVTALNKFYDLTIQEINKPGSTCKTMPKPLQN